MLYRLVEDSWHRWRRAGWLVRPHPLYAPLHPRKPHPRGSAAEALGMLGALGSVW